MIPWLQSNFNFPLSGDVAQNIDPDLFFETINPEVGDKEIEKEIVLKVASYGDQLGLIIKVLMAIADELNLNNEQIAALTELKELQVKIQAIKTSNQDRIKENARKMLDKLKNSDPEALNDLLKEYQK